MKTMLRKKVIHSMISDIYLARNRSIMRISAACSCHIGKRRKNNEDNFFFAGRYMASCNNGLGSILEKNFPLKKDRFFAVFDGMGGGEYGEIASYMGAKATEEYLNAEEADDIAGKKGYLEKMCTHVNDRIFKETLRLDAEMMGSTLAGLYFTGNQVWTVNVGDSRCFLLRDGKLRQISEDQTDEAYMKENGIQVVSEKWLANYESIYAEARRAWKEKILEEAKFVENPFDAYAENPFAMPEGRAVTAEDTVDAQTAIYVVSRISGEGKDRRRVEGDYYLSRREREDIRFLDAQKIPTVLILNSGGPVELTDILEETENICAVLNISQLGQRGGLALANVLLGKVTPGGKLTATWARRYEDYPCAEEYSYLNGKLEREEYKEGIYTGYRYFDTFGVKPLFPFGYGLSYTEMQIRFHGMKTSGDGVEVEAEVTNTGETFSGKEVVQVYVSLPQDELGKEYRRLAGFAKTKLLKPGEKELLKIRIDRKTLAYFSEEQHAWIAEKGYYAVWVGNSIASLTLVAMLEVPESVILDKTNILENQTDITEEVYDRQNLSARTLKWKEKAENEKIGRYIYYPEPEKRTECTCQPENKIPAKDLLPLFYGNIAGISSNLGAAGIRVPGSAGETTAALYEQYGVSPLIMADGPAGLRLQQNYEVDRETDTVYGIGVLGSLENGYLRTDETHENADRYYQFCTAFPVGTALAQTWDTALVEKVGIAVAEEMEEFHIDLWLAPGLNIQRNPLCGRNFEYYSEDPLLSGTMAAAMTKGVQSRPGCGVTVKHFACNNQEDNRMGVDAQVSERALREIYLRGFEIAVKESRPVAIMSSYNLLNGVHAANSVDLCTAIARKEWGFDGVIMSDWNTTVPEDGSIPWKCVTAGNDIIMPGNADDAENIRKAFEDGKLSEEVVRMCAGRILNLIHTLTAE